MTLPKGCTSSLEVIHDRSLTEILVGGGMLTFTLRSFVDPASSGAGLLVEDVLTLSAGSIRTFVQAPQAC